MVNRKIIMATSVLIMGSLVGCSDGEAPLADIELAWQSAIEDNSELQSTLERLYKDCMEEEGFHAHPATLGAWENTNYAEESFDSYLSRLFPPREEAEDVGMSASPEESILDRINNPDEADIPIDVVGDDARTDYGRLSYGERSRYNQALEGYLYSEADDAEASGEQVLPNHEVVVIGNGVEVQYPTVGCKSEVHESVFGGTDGIREYHELKGYVIDLWPRYAVNKVETDSSFLSAESDWSGCMESGGIDGLENLRGVFSALDEIWQPAYESTLSDEEWDALKQQEIEVVLTHLDCAAEVELREKMESAHSEASDAFMVDHEAEFFAWRDFVDESLTSAQGLL